MTDDNYYEILELSPDASQEAVKKAYKKMALRWHPDKNSTNRTEAECRFKQIGQAYEVLSNPTRRAAYDRRRGQRRPFATESPAGSSDSDDDIAAEFAASFRDPAEVFREFFRDAAWSGWAGAEAAEWEALIGRAFDATPHPEQNPHQPNVSVFVSSSVINRDGANETVTTKTVTQGGVRTKTVTVIRNGQVVEKRTVTSVGGAVQSGSQQGQASLASREPQKRNKAKGSVKK